MPNFEDALDLNVKKNKDIYKEIAKLHTEKYAKPSLE